MTMLALGMPGGWEWLIIGAIGLLLFGRRLPEVGRSLGRGIVEFKKGLKGIEEEIETASSPKTSAASAEKPALRAPEEWNSNQPRVPQTEKAPE